jgi:hypothetical protein
VLNENKTNNLKICKDTGLLCLIGPHWTPLDPLKAVFAASNCVNLNLRNYQGQPRLQVVTFWHFGDRRALIQGTLVNQGEVAAASYPWPFKAEIVAEDAARRVTSILRIRADITKPKQPNRTEGRPTTIPLHLTPSHLIIKTD